MNTTLTFFRSDSFIDWSALNEHEYTVEGDGKLRFETDEHLEMTIYLGDTRIATLNTWEKSPWGGDHADVFPHWEIEGSGAKYDGVWVSTKVAVKA